MKNVILSADNEMKVYSVPDEVADDLDKYCMEFCCEWLKKSPHARKYRKGGGLLYNEEDFIEYLNKWIFPDKRSVLIENIGWTIPDKYRELPSFNF